VGPIQSSTVDSTAEFLEGVLVVDPATGKFVAGNAPACALLGCSAAELIALGPADIHPQFAVGSMADALTLVALPDETHVENVLVVRPDQSWFRASVSVTAITIAGRRYLLETFQDAQFVRNLRAGMAAKELLEPLSSLAPGITHDIKNALTYVIYYLDRLIDLHSEQNPQPQTRPTNEHVLRLLGDIQSGVDSIRRVADGMSALSRTRQSAEESGVDVNEVMENAVALVDHAARFSAVISTDLAPAPILVRASRSELTRILIGLLLRAIKTIERFSLKEGRIEVRTSTEHGNACVQIHHAGDSMDADSGNALSQASAWSDVEEFIQSRRLAACEEFVRKSGGGVNVIQRDGFTSTVTIRLPLESAAPRSGWIESGMSETGRACTRQRVLIVEDDPDVCEILREMLSAEHNVSAVSSGQAAQQFLADTSVDVIISDVMMPGISGVDLRDWLAERDPEAARRLIFVTGGVLSQQIACRLDQLNNLRLYKPFSEDSVRDIIRLASALKPEVKAGVEIKS